MENWFRSYQSIINESEREIVNGWTINRLPDGFDNKYEAVKDGYGTKFYSYDAAVKFANEHNTVADAEATMRDQADSFSHAMRVHPVNEESIEEDMIQQPNTGNAVVQPQQSGQTDANAQPQQSAPGAIKPQGSQSAADLHQAAISKAAQANSGGVNSVPDMLKGTQTPMKPNLNEAEVDTIQGSAHWAPFLINGDSEGLDQHDLDLCNRWYSKNVPDGWHIVDCSEPHFSWSYGDITGDDTSGGDIVEYTIVK